MTQMEIWEQINLMHSKMNALNLNTVESRALARFYFQELVSRSPDAKNDSLIRRKLNERIAECFSVESGPIG